MNGITALLDTELRRFASRRVMRGALAFGIALSTLVLVIIVARSDVKTVSGPQTFTCTQEPSGAEPSTVSPGATVPSQNCTATVGHDRRIKIGDNLAGTIRGVGVAMVFAAFILGASFIGAEFAAGSIGAQLVFEPRRQRVVAVKALAVGIGSAVLAVVLLLYIALFQYVGSELRGVVSGLDASWFAARAGDMGRVAAAVALAAIAAYAVTVVTRRTVAAVAGLIVVAWVAGAIGSLHNWRWVAKYNPTSAFLAMALDVTRHRGDSGSPILAVRGATVSACAWAVGLTVIAAAVFARREVR